MSDQINQNNAGSETQTFVQKTDILDTPKPNTQTPELINQQMLETPTDSPEYPKLLGALNKAVSGTSTEQAPPQSKNTEITQVRTSETETNAISKLSSAVALLDPKYPGDIDILNAHLSEQRLNSNILNPLLTEITDSARNTTTELSQIEAEKRSGNATPLRGFAKKIISRISSSGANSEQVLSSCGNIQKTYGIEPDSGAEAALPSNPDVKTSEPSDSTKAELLLLNKYIESLNTDKQVLQRRIKETISSNDDLKKQVDSLQPEIQKKHDKIIQDMEQLPSKTNKLAA
ncbi:hypothetical protein ACFL14_01745 [Patescibacteria group bacterium]